MHILVVNAGSTSVKLAAVHFADHHPQVIQQAQWPAKQGRPEGILADFAPRAATPDVVVHRVVHGADELTRSCLVDEHVEGVIESLAALAPLHNPVALTWIRTARTRFDCPQGAVFDTAFFANMPQRTRHYALPRELADKHRIRRYGFHGIAHRAMWERWCELRPDLAKGGRLITIQLGGGCSMAALDAGQPLDNSMGFSPAEGLVMATRCGDVDAGAVLHLVKRAGIPAADMEALLNRDSGLLGLSGHSDDLRELVDAVDPASRLAVELYCYRLRKYLGAFLAVLRGADGIVFGGGVGEHQPVIRSRVLEDMQWCGIEIDKTRNRQARAGEASLSSSDSRIDMRVLPADETGVLAREAYTLMNP
jgi:acetate kinase